MNMNFCRINICNKFYKVDSLDHETDPARIRNLLPTAHCSWVSPTDEIEKPTPFFITIYN